MTNHSNPIGLLDSGLGGLTVLKTAAGRLPQEHFIFYADLKHSPYGGRSKAELAGLIQQAVAVLLKKNIKALVLASNTATSAAVETLRARLAIPVIGVEPALKPAVQATPRGKILVLATELTLREEKFIRLYGQYQERGNIILKSCPGLVEIIDRGILQGRELDDCLSDLFRGLTDEPIATLVLGCTHYILIKDAIRRHFPGAANCLDGNEGVARQLAKVLSEHTSVPGSGMGSVEFLSSLPEKLPLLENIYRQLGA